jgi:hypothetical protein
MQCQQILGRSIKIPCQHRRTNIERDYIHSFKEESYIPRGSSQSLLHSVYLASHPGRQWAFLEWRLQQQLNAHQNAACVCGHQPSGIPGQDNNSKLPARTELMIGFANATSVCVCNVRFFKKGTCQHIPTTLCTSKKHESGIPSSCDDTVRMPEMET